MKTLTRQEAAAKGYHHITHPINVKTEKHVMDSIEKCLGAMDAVWISVTHGFVEAARKHKDVRTSYSKPVLPSLP